MERETWRDEHGETVSGDFNEEHRGNCKVWKTKQESYKTEGRSRRRKEEDGIRRRSWRIQKQETYNRIKKVS